MSRAKTSRVLLTEDAERDIEDIHWYVTANDSLMRADTLLDELEVCCTSLADLPERGNVPKELRDIGITDYREIHHKFYRIIYRVFGREVIVYCILDGRRDMQSQLQRRVLR